MSVDDQRYPLLVKEDGGRYGRRPYGTPGSDLVADKIRTIIGWRPRVDDMRGFEAALRQSFTYVENDEGLGEWLYTPHSYSIREKLGAVTGAQASIYRRAQTTISQARPLLDDLKSLGHEKDVDEGEAVRSIIRTRLDGLVAELGREGGPRVVRVDMLFKALLGENWFENNFTSVADVDDESLYGRLQTYFGLTSDQINTIEDEQNVTNFLTVVDYTISIANSWNQQRDAFRTSGDVFLGTQLVHVSRALDVVAESVHELYELLDSVFIDESEREIIELDLANEEDNLTLAGLLDWIDLFATDEGPRLIEDGGREGVQETAATLIQLTALTEQMNALVDSDDSDIPDAFFSNRVQEGITSLKKHLKTARDWTIPIVPDEEDDDSDVIVDDPVEDEQPDPQIAEWINSIEMRFERTDRRLSAMEGTQDDILKQLAAIQEQLEGLIGRVDIINPAVIEEPKGKGKGKKPS